MECEQKLNVHAVSVFTHMNVSLLSGTKSQCLPPSFNILSVTKSQNTIRGKVMIEINVILPATMISFGRQPLGLFRVFLWCCILFLLVGTMSFILNVLYLLVGIVLGISPFKFWKIIIENNNNPQTY